MPSMNLNVTSFVNACSTLAILRRADMHFDDFKFDLFQLRIFEDLI